MEGEEVSKAPNHRPLSGRVALVAGATRGAGRAIAVELARSGAYVYATGRSSRAAGRSEIDRPETIEETGELIAAVGGEGTALRVDHLEPDQVAGLVGQIEAEQGRLDVLVNDIFGGDRYAQWDKKLWEHDLAGGLRMLRMGIDTHLITAAKALPLMLRGEGGLVIEMTDGTSETQVGSCRAPSWRGRTESPTPTEPSPTAGAISSRSSWRDDRRRSSATASARPTSRDAARTA
jgi:NAD(P)-dependent dehydrogenase (short-subunit alcohol dehydrogenase family)